MNKIILFSLACTGFLAIVPVAANALNSQTVDRNFNGEPNVRLAQFRHHRNRDSRSERLRQRQFAVYYRSPRDRQWTLEGPHPDRRDAERAASRLQRRGFITYIQVSREVKRHMGRD